MKQFLALFYLVAIVCYALLAFVPLFISIRKAGVYKVFRMMWILLTLAVIICSVLTVILLLI